MPTPTPPARPVQKVELTFDWTDLDGVAHKRGGVLEVEVPVATRLLLEGRARVPERASVIVLPPETAADGPADPSSPTTTPDADVAPDKKTTKKGA